MLATAKRVEGETSASSALIDASRLSAVSLRPSATSEKRSVLAVHSTITLSHPDLALIDNQNILPTKWYLLMMGANQLVVLMIII